MMIKSVSRYVALGGIVACVTAAHAAPVQWTIATGGNGHWYEIVQAPGINWYDARSAAQGLSHMGLQGDLATVNSYAEWTFMQSMGYLHQYWLGATNNTFDLWNGASWNWINGEGNASSVQALFVWPGYEGWETPPFGLLAWWDVFGDWQANLGAPHTQGYIVEYQVRGGGGGGTAIPGPLAALPFLSGLIALRRRKSS
jgi:hypothetical protein